MPLLNVEVTTIVQSGVYFQNVFPYMCYPLPYTYNKTTDLRNWERGVFLIEWQGIKLKCKFVSDTHKALDLLSRGSSLLYFFFSPKSARILCVYRVYCTQFTMQNPQRSVFRDHREREFYIEWNYYNSFIFMFSLQINIYDHLPTFTISI